MSEGSSPFAERALHVVLLSPEIHWNTGNAGRTCLAAGAQLHLIRPLGFSLADRQIRRAGLDYWEHVHPRVWDDWPAFEQALAGREPYLLCAEAKRSLWDVALEPPVILVFGRESTGLPARLRERYSERMLRIPMAENAPRSLNLSSAVAVAAYEALRQLGLPGPDDTPCEGA